MAAIYASERCIHGAIRFALGTLSAKIEIEPYAATPPEVSVHGPAGIAEPSA